MTELRNLAATRYVQPLREGGSLPAIVDTDGDGLYVAKFRGAGQGAKALIAELIVGQLAQATGLPTPDLASIKIPESFGQSEPDPEIQDLLRKSHGVNFGLRYLDGAFNYDPNAADEFISSELASRIVWFDAFLTNPDRTHRNPNLLIWNRKPWLIDHGAALYAHHDWKSVDESRTRSAFPLIKDHVLLSGADQIDQADNDMVEQLSAESVTKAVSDVPDDLLRDETVAADFSNSAAVRRRYVDYLMLRLTEPRSFVTEAIEARTRSKKTKPRRVASRR
jgi:hypothetical protein